MFKKFGIYSFMCAFLSVFIFAGCTASTPEPFNVSGKVVYKGTPIEGVKVLSDIGLEQMTDKDGKFLFENLGSATIFSFESADYVFSKPKMIAYKKTENVVIEAEKKYNISGQILSNNVGVSRVNVTISGLIPLSIITDSNGCFNATVAGEVVIEAKKEGYLFEKKTATIDNSNLKISGTTDISVSINNASGAIVKLNNQNMTFSNGKYSAKNVNLGSVITPTLDGYHFEPESYTITKENENVVFNAYPLYNVTGVTKSGEHLIKDTQVFVNGEKKAISNEAGEFVLTELWGENSISFHHKSFSFNSSIIKEKSNIVGEGNFCLNGYVIYQDLPLSDVLVTYGEKRITTDENGFFSFDKAVFGAEITFQKLGYFIENLEVNKVSNEIIYAQKYFTSKVFVNLDGEPLVGASVKNTSTNQVLLTDSKGAVEFVNCLDNFSVEISKDGYTKKIANITRENNEILVNVDEYYQCNIKILSGEIPLVDAKIWIAEIGYSMDENAIFTLQNCTKPLNLSIIADGYNTKNISIDKNNCDLTINLDYTIFGEVNNGDLKVDAQVVATDKQGQKNIVDTVNGQFEMALFGENKIEIVADGLAYEMQSVTSDINGKMIFNTEYSISGKLTADNLPLESMEVTLVSAKETLKTYTNKEGLFAFSQLQGQYKLITQNPTGVILRPAFYTITKGGTYNFDASGYAAKGKVLCGGVGVSDVMVRANDDFVYTNELGEFKFDLLMGDVELVAIKKGYEFPDKIKLTPDTITEDDVIFDGTYKVTGVVKCGNLPLENVNISIGEKSFVTDKSGVFEIIGLSNTQNLKFEKTDFVFDNEISVTEYNELEIFATTSVSGVVKIGDFALKDVEISNGKFTQLSNDSGEFTLSGVSFGQKLFANKKGFRFNEFESITIDILTYEFLGVYDVSGIVKSAGVAVKDVEVTFEGQSVTTDAGGKFEFLGLDKFGTLTFKKVGYTFAPVSVNGPKDFEILASFNINGRVTLGDKGLEDVKIYYGDNITYTDFDGYYTLENLSTAGLLSIEKDGYDFKGEMYFSGAATLDFSATYFVKFKVSCGDADMGKAVIDTTAKLETYPDNTFIIRGLLGKHTFIVNNENHNFDQKEVAVTGYTPNMVVELTYSVIFKLKDKLNDVVLTYTDNKQQKEVSFNTQGIAKIDGIFGAGQWIVSKPNYKFTPNQGTFSLPKEIILDFDIVYSISGNIKSGDIPVVGMTVTLNGETAVTDKNGHYVLTNLVGNGTLKGVLSAENCDNVEVRKDNISKSDVYDIQVDNATYAYWLWQKAYQNLTSNKYGYRINTTSLITPDTNLTGPQHAEIVRQKDKNGVYLLDNRNHGDPVVGIDPRIQLIGYYDSKVSNSIMQYKFIHNKNFSKDVVFYRNNHVEIDQSMYQTVKYQDIEIDTSANSFEGIFGNHPTKTSIYNINKNTISSFSKLTKDANGQIKFTIILDCSPSCLAFYKKQIDKVSGQNPNFKKIEISYVLDKDGNLISSSGIEEYDVPKPIVGGYVFTDAKITETYTRFTAENADANLIDKAKFGI